MARRHSQSQPGEHIEHIAAIQTGQPKGVELKLRQLGRQVDVMVDIVVVFGAEVVEAHVQRDDESRGDDEGEDGETGVLELPSATSVSFSVLRRSRKFPEVSLPLSKQGKGGGLLCRRVDDHEDAIGEGGPEDRRKESRAEGVQYRFPRCFPFGSELEETDPRPQGGRRVVLEVQLRTIRTRRDRIDLLAACRDL